MLFLLLLNLPVVQKSISILVTNELKDLLQTEVHIGNIDLGLLNRIIVDDIKIEDQEGEDLLTIARLAVKLEILPLLQGQISISNIQIFSFKLNTYQKNENQPINCQFILDKLTPDNKKEKGNLNLRINAILMRRGEMCFDKKYITETPERFNPAHIHISNISTNIALKAFQKDSLNLAVKRLSLKDKSGLTLDNLRFKITANQNTAHLTDFELKLPNSNIQLDSLWAYYNNLPFNQSDSSWLKKMEAHSEIVSSTINLKDLCCFIPNFKDLDFPFYIKTFFHYENQKATIDKFQLYSKNQECRLKAHASFQQAIEKQKNDSATINIQELEIKPTIKNLLEQIFPKANQVYYKMLEQSGSNHLTAYLSYHNKLETNLNLKNNCGNLFVTAELDQQKRFRSRIHTDAFDFSVLDSLKTDLGKISLNLFLNGTFDQEKESKQKIKDLHIKGNINNLEFKKYNYQKILLDVKQRNQTFSGNISMNDPHGSFNAEGTLTSSNHKGLKAKLLISLKDFSPNTLNLTKKFKNTRFSTNLETDFDWKSIDQVSGYLNLTDLIITKDTTSKKINLIAFNCTDEEGNRKILFSSDFLSAEINGQFKINHLIASLERTVYKYLPSLKSNSKTEDYSLQENNFTMRINVKDTELLPYLLDIPLTITKPAYFYGVYRSNLNNLQINCAIPDIHYGTQYFKNISLNCVGNHHLIQGNFEGSKITTKKETLFRMNLNAEKDTVSTSIKWLSPDDNIFNGNFEFSTSFQRNEQNKINTNIRILPSQFTLDNSQWNVHASSINIAPEKVRIENFLIEQPGKHLEIGGIVSQNAKDSIIADLKYIDLQYIFNLIAFDAVQFGGHATGKVFATDLFKNPNIKALLDVPDFTLNQGKMGSLNIFGKWEMDTKSIYLNAMMNDPLKESITRVSGNITPGHTSKSGIDLKIMANRTNLYFLNKYTEGIFTNLQGRATGKARVFGPFQKINLEGDLLVNEADMHIDILNTHYRLYNDSVILRPDNIWFNNADIYDDYGQVGGNKHYALVTGHLKHENFSNLSYDILINAQNILGYDQKDFGDNVFCGTAYASGKAHIYGKPGRLNVDLNIHPEEKTEFVYNLSSPDVITDTPFIRFVNKSKTSTDSTLQTRTEKEVYPITTNAPTSDVYVNFQLDITPKATMKILMDAKSGDYISLNGFGNMRATFYNKGKFQLYGTARINEGIYKLSLQDVIKKDFQITPGGTVTFGGDPAEAELNLQAVYTVPSVSLNDLNPQGTFSQSNVRVNCLMNLTGKARQPHIAFDFDIPNVNEDEKQMVKTLISTEEEKNLQTIYLLGIGRFYGYNYNTTQQNQSSLAMNSLLSSTLSGQLNEMLSNIIGSNNWNFGTNLSTGEEGWSDMDIEGLLSGKLMNNRLLINGNFGYKENATLNKSSNFIGDFDVQWLLTKNGNIRLKGYSETNDRYFTKSSLTTQGIGIQLKKDFSSWRELFNLKSKQNNTEKEEEKKRKAEKK